MEHLIAGSSMASTVEKGFFIVLVASMVAMLCSLSRKVSNKNSRKIATGAFLLVIAMCVLALAIRGQETISW